MTNTTSSTKIPSSLAAACDNVERPNEPKMGTIEYVKAFILANAPLKFKASAAISSSLTRPGERNEDAAEERTTSSSSASNEQQQEERKEQDTDAFKEAAELEKLIQMLIFRDGEGRTALHWAIALKNFDLARSLLQIAGQVQQQLLQYQSQQQQQNEQGNDDKNAFLIAPWSLPPDSNSTTVLASACAVSAPIELIAELIHLATGIKGVVAAGGGGSVDSVNVSKAQQQQQALQVQQQHPFIALPDSQGNTALHLAASRGNIKLVAFLVNNFNADLREQNKKGQTALHRIVARGDSNAVEEVLVMARKRFPNEVKKFVNCVDTNGDTALHYASMEENREIGEFLLRNSADRNIKNKNGKEYWQL